MTQEQESVVLHGDSHDKRGADEIFGVCPIGAGTWFWGTLLQIPTGWKLADGTFQVNGSTPPDMRDRMPIGAGTTYALGATGGAAPGTVTLVHDHNHDAITHNHDGAAVANHVNHSHLVAVSGMAEGSLNAGSTGLFFPFNVSGASISPTANESPTPQVHTVTQPAAHGAITGHDDHSFATTLPPYAAWYFIVRVR